MCYRNSLFCCTKNLSNLRTVKINLPKTNGQYALERSFLEDSQPFPLLKGVHLQDIFGHPPTQINPENKRIIFQSACFFNGRIFVKTGGFIFPNFAGWKLKHIGFTNTQLCISNWFSYQKTAAVHRTMELFPHPKNSWWFQLIWNILVKLDHFPK